MFIMPTFSDHSNIEEETPIGTPIGTPRNKNVGVGDMISKLAGLMEESLVDEDLDLYTTVCKQSYKCSSS